MVRVSVDGIGLLIQPGRESTESEARHPLPVLIYYLCLFVARHDAGACLALDAAVSTVFFPRRASFFVFSAYWVIVARTFLRG